MLASDTTSSNGGTGSAGGGAGAAGAAADVSLITKDTQAYLDTGAAVNAQGGVSVRALNSEQVLSVAASAAGGGLALAGAASTYKLNDTTTAYIGDNATVFTSGSADVAASDLDQILEVDGAFTAPSSGLAGALGLTILDKTTSAYVGNGASVTALGNGTAITADTGLFDVADGNRPKGAALTDALNTFAGKAASLLGLPDLTHQRVAVPVTTSFNGLAVTAVSQDDIETAAGGLGVGTATSVNIEPVASVDLPENVTTTAAIDPNAQVNVNGDTGAAKGQSVLVAAGSDYYHLGVAGAAGEGYANLAPSAEVTSGGFTTTASIGQGATVKAAGDVLVTADAAEDVVSIALGLSAANIAVSASASVVSLTDHVHACIDQSATVTAGGSVLVVANDSTGTTELIGTAALGIGIAGLDASVGVTLLNKDTQAYIGGSAVVNASGNTTTDLSDFGAQDTTPAHKSVQGVDVEANSGETDSTGAVGGALGAFAALAGAVSVEVITTNTQASIDDGAQVNLSAASPGANQSVYVSATDAQSVSALDGSASASLAGSLAGGVDVGVIDDNTAATLGGAQVHAASDVVVQATGSKTINSTPVAAGGALGIGIAGAVSVYALDGSLDSDSQTATNDGSQTDPKNKNYQPSQSQTAGQYADGQTGGGSVTSSLDALRNGSANDNSSAGKEIRKLTKNNKDSVTNAAANDQVSGATGETAPPVAPGTTAVIDPGATVVAGRSIGVGANDTVTLTVTVGSIAAGFVGVGGSVAVVNVDDPVTAQVGDGASLQAGSKGKVSVTANFTDTTTANAYAGSGGFVSLGAQVVEVNDNATTTAQLGTGTGTTGAQVVGANNVIVSGTASRNVTANATGGGFGDVVAGVAVVKTNVGGSTSASVGAEAQVGLAGGTAVNNLTVAATDTSTGNATATAVDAGLYAGAVNRTTATVDPTVSAAVFGKANVNVANDAIVSATENGTAGATVNGFGVGAVQVGVSLPSATLSPTVSAVLGESAVVNAGGTIGFSAGMGIAGDTATGTASGGGLLSGNGVSAGVTFEPSLTTEVKTDAQATAGGDLGLATSINPANLNVLTDAQSASYGALGIGDSVASTTASPSLTTAVDDGAQLTAGGALNVTALTTDSFGSTTSGAIDTKADAGAGALIGVSGTQATLSDTPTVEATLGDNVALSAGGSLAVEAQSNLSAVTITPNETRAQVSASERNGAPEANADANGVLAVGLTSLGVTLTNTAKVVLGSGDSLTGGGGVTLGAQTYDHMNPLATGGVGGALASGLGTETTVTLGDEAKVFLAGSDSVQAPGAAVTIEATGGGSVNPAASDLTSFSVGSSDDASVTMTGNDGDLVNIGDNCDITADTLDVEAGARGYSVNATSSTNSTTALNQSNATTTLSPSFTSGINVQQGTNLTGYSSVTLSADQTNDISDATATAENNGGLSAVTADVEHTFAGTTNIDVFDGTKINSRNLSVSADTPTFTGDYSSEANFQVSTVQQVLNDVLNTAVSVLTFGLVSNASPDQVIVENTNTRSGTIRFNAAVTLLTAADPALFIDSKGRVTQARDVTWTKSGNTITVSPIADDTAPGMTFNGPDSVTLEGTPSVTLQDGYQNVSIINTSALNLVVKGIRTYALPATETITLPFGAKVTMRQIANIDYNVATNDLLGFSNLVLPPTDVDIQNTGGSLLTLSGAIDNPFGTTNIESAGGIKVSAATDSVTTSALTLTSEKGGVGTSSQPIPVVLVNAVAPGEPAASLGGSASGSFYASVSRQTYALLFFGLGASSMEQQSPSITNITAGGLVNLTLNGGQVETASQSSTPPGAAPANPWEELISFAAANLVPSLSQFFSPFLPEYNVWSSDSPYAADYNVSGVTGQSGVTIADTSDNLSATGVSAPGGRVTLSAAGALTGAGQAGSPDVSAKSATLTAGSAGTSSQAFELAVGTLTGSSQGGAWLENTGALTLGKLSAGGQLVLTNHGDVTVTGAVSAATDVILHVPDAPSGLPSLTLNLGSSLTSSGGVSAIIPGSIAVAAGSKIGAAESVVLQGGHLGNTMGSAIAVAGAVSGSSVEIDGGPNDTITVSDVPARAPTTIDAVGGGNTIDVSSLKTIKGGLTVNGSATDTLKVSDTGDTAAATGSLSATQLTGLNMGTAGITYSGIGTLTVTLDAAHGNRFTVTGVNSSTGTTIDGGTAKDAKATVNVTGDFNGSLTLKDFANTNVNVTGNFNGSLTTGAIGTLTVGGAVKPGSVIQAASVGTMTVGPNKLTVGDDMAGSLQLSGNLGSLTVAGGTPGTISAKHVGTIGAYGGFGPVVLDVIENGVERRVVEGTAADPYPQPNANATATTTAGGKYVNIQFFYESGAPSSPGSLPNPQLTARVTNNVGIQKDQYDLSLETFNDKAKFNLARLEAVGIAGVGNVTVEGDVLTKVTAPANLFFGSQAHGTTVPDTTPAGVRLPQDQLAGVEVRDFLPPGEVQALSIEALAFGSYKATGGSIATGATASAAAAAGLLAPTTQTAWANDTFRVPFADQANDKVGLFLGAAPTVLSKAVFNGQNVAFTVESLVSANAAGTVNVTTPMNAARGAAVALVTVAETIKPILHTTSSEIDSIDVTGDGASIGTSQWVADEISSTGPLGDLNLLSTQGVTDVTAPSIFGSIVTNGSIDGTIQTTGVRVDPIAGASTNVPADLGSVYVTGSGASVHPAATVVQATGNLDGMLVSRGSLLSQVTAGGISGVVAAAGNIGSVYGSTRLGGIVSNGDLTGDVVALGQVVGNVVVHGNLSGHVVSKDGIFANVTVDRAIEAGAAVVSQGGIGGSSLGTTLKAGSIGGIVAAEGPINLAAGVSTSGAQFYKASVGPSDPSRAAIDALFSAPGTAVGLPTASPVPIPFDLSGLDLGGLALILQNVDALHVANGALAD